MRRDFGKLNSGAITYAPNAINNDFNAPASTYIAAGWLPVITDNKPAEKVGVTHSPSGWEQRDGAIYRTWTETPVVAPVVVHKYSKLKLITAAKQAGKWDALKAWIASAGYSDEWAACMYLSDDYEGFDQIKAAIVAAGVATDDELTAILAAAEDETLQGA